MDYDSLKAAGSSRRLRRRSSSWTRPPAWCGCSSAWRASTCRESCGQCTPCREGTGWLNRMLKRIMAGQGRSEDLESAGRCGQPHRRPHHLRAGRCRGVAGAELPQALPPRVRIHDRHTAAAPSSTARRGGGMSAFRRHAASRDAVRRRQHRSQRRAAARPQGPDDHAGHGRAERLHAALLLPRQADRRGQLPHVPGRSGEGAEADAGLRHAGDRRHEGLHADRPRPSPRSARPWNSCSSIIRSIARSATRAASASCRIWPWASAATSRASTSASAWSRTRTSGRSCPPT